MAQKETTNQTVERAFALVEALAQSGSLTQSELAKLAGVSLSTASRLVGTLEDLGVVHRQARTGLLTLGTRCAFYGAAALNASDLYRASRQVAHDVAAELGLGVNVAQLEAGKVTYILNAEGRFSPRSFSLAGRTQPAHATGLGKALVSEQPPDRLAELVGVEPYQSFTPFTITTTDALVEALAAVRQCGYATEIEELAFGRACIAAPIRAAGGVIAGAISLSGPLRILDLEHRLHELGRHAIEAADAVAAALDFEPAQVVVRG